MTTIDPELNSVVFAIGMAIFGAGFGFIAAQLGNVIMSSVGNRDRGEAGGLQGTAQNIGTSVGVALLGALLVAALSSGFNTAAQADSTISAQTKSQINDATANGVEILGRDQLEAVAQEHDIPAGEVSTLVDDYVNAQLEAIKMAILLAVFLALLGLVVAQRLPTVPGAELGKDEPAAAGK